MRDMIFTRDNFDQLLDERTVLRSENDQLKSEIRLLQEKVQYLLKKLFGRSSEKLNPNQLQLALDELRGLQEALELAEAKATLYRATRPASLPTAFQGQHKQTI